VQNERYAVIPWLCAARRFTASGFGFVSQVTCSYCVFKDVLLSIEILPLQYLTRIIFNVQTQSDLAFRIMLVSYNSNRVTRFLLNIGNNGAMYKISDEHLRLFQLDICILVAPLFLDVNTTNISHHLSYISNKCRKIFIVFFRGGNDVFETLINVFTGHIKLYSCQNITKTNVMMTRLHV